MTWWGLLLSSVAVALTLLAGLVLWLRGQVLTLRRLLAEEWQQLLAVQQSIEQLSRQRIIERLEALEERIDTLADAQRILESRELTPAPYAEAVQQARAGAGVEALMAAHRLSRPEAELIVRLHAIQAPDG